MELVKAMPATLVSFNTCMEASVAGDHPWSDFKLILSKECEASYAAQVSGVLELQPVRHIVVLAGGSVAADGGDVFVDWPL